MMQTIYTLLLFGFTVLWYQAQDSTAQPADTAMVIGDTAPVDSMTTVEEMPPAAPVEAVKKPVVQNIPFKIGEQLTFKIRYGFIRAGTATMTVKGETSVRGNPVYHIQTTAESAAGFSWFYKVEDVIDSYMDKNGLFTWKFDKRLREGSYKIDLLIDYNPQDTVANVDFTKYDRRMRVEEESKYHVRTPLYPYDVLAAFYYTRTQDLQIGNSISVVNHDHKKTYNLLVKVHRRETIETDAGTFRCLVVEPLLQGEGIFQQKGRLVVWMTDDAFKIPVQMESEVAVGSITAELEEISGIREPIPAKIAGNE